MEQWRFGGILSGLSQEFQTGFVENEEIFQRKELFTDISEITTGKIFLSKNKYLQFKNFYLNRLKHGIIPFCYYDCITDVYVIMSFVEKPTYKELYGWWEVSLKVRVL